MRRLFVLLTMATVVVGLAAPQVVARASGSAGTSLSAQQLPRLGAPTIRPAGAVSTPGAPGQNTPAGRRLLSQGYVVPDQAAYDRAKAAAEARAPEAGPALARVRAPTVPLSWAGVNDTNVTPSDSNGAIGTKRYMEVVNDEFGLYDRTGAIKSTGTLAALTGDVHSLTDPVVIWDPGTKRFYFAVLNFSSGDGIDYDFGFSKTASPNGQADFCKYNINYGYDDAGLLPDYDKMGDTKDFILFGANVFNFTTEAFVSADAQWVTKPPAGTTCPSGGTFMAAVKQNLKNADGSQAFTLEPVNQTDTNAKGWIISGEDAFGGPGNALEVFSVKKNSTTGAAVIAAQAKSIAVPSYSIPPAAPQSGTTRTLDTLDARVTLSVSAVDPGHGGKVGIWTQHTVAGGAGSQVRWYEVDPVALAVLQSGAATNASLFAFNGAIAPDRRVNGTTKQFGDSMVLEFNTSSSSAFSAIRVISKIGAAAQSGFVLVKQSPGNNVDFACSPTCRWGDYSGATPDPASPTGGAHGQVWITGMWNVASTSTTNVDWRTQNARVVP